MNLLYGSKKALVYFIPLSQFIMVDSFDKLDALIAQCDDETKDLYQSLQHDHLPKDGQVTIWGSQNDIL